MFASVAQCFIKGSNEADPLVLRAQVCDFMSANLNFEIQGLSIKHLIDTIRLDIGERFPTLSKLNSTEAYIRYMRRTVSFGDNLELIIIAILRRITIIIFEQVEGGFRFREAITEFGEEGKVIYLNFKDQIHYENLIVEEEEIRLRHRLKFNIASQSRESNNLFNYSINFLKPKTFDMTSHMDDLQLQRVLNLSFDESTLAAERASSVKSVDSDPTFDHVSKTYAEEFEEEDTCQDISQKVGDGSQLEILVASLGIGPRPYSADYEDCYEKSSFNLTDIASDNDFIKWCASYNEEIIMLTMPLKKQPIGSLRARLGDEIVDEASIKEMKQILHKKVWFGVTADLVRDLHRRKIIIIPLIDLVKEKLTADGEHEKVKSRIIVLGNKQEKLPSSRTEAPTAQLQSFYIFIFIAAKRGIKIMSLDVTGAFLNADLEEGEEVYVRLNKKMTEILCKINPEWRKFVLADGTMVVKLRKCLYGLQISPQRWYKTMDRVLRKLGFTPSEFDLCLYYKIEPNDVLNYALLFVDDLALACENKELERSIIREMEIEFEGVTLQEGDTISYLGFNITQTKEGISLDQSGYIKKMVKSLNLEKIPSYNNPFASDFKVNKDRYLKPAVDANPKKVWMMKHLSMTLLYLASRTRRDLQFAAAFFAGIKCPEDEDIKAVTRAMVYALNTVEKKQMFYKEGAMTMISVGDASNSLLADTRAFGCAIIFADKHSAALEMSVNVEKFLSKSSYESEIVLQNKLAMMGKRTALLFAEIGIVITPPIQQYCDHLEVVNTANKEHLLKSGQTKFMSRNLFQLFAEVLNKIISFLWVSSKRNLADIGTKPVQGSQYKLLADQTFSRLVGLPEETLEEISEDAPEEESKSVDRSDVLQEEDSKYPEYWSEFFKY